MIRLWRKKLIMQIKFKEEINNDGNVIRVSEDLGYCEKCFKKIESGRFCCWECRREFYAEVRYDSFGVSFDR